MTINRLLVANRAEIAARVFRTCRALGIEAVAVHSDADADLPYVREADLAVRLPGTAPADTYLRSDLLVDAARRSGADAVHPGYGFLSENADFAQAVRDAGLTWVGPFPSSIRSMGSKIEAKRLMKAAGVPVLEAPESPTEADLPLLVKASAGGGGRGMRVVRRLEDLPGEVARAEAEAASAFGDGTVFLEPYVESGRHVEVQVLGRGRGTPITLGTRDCSVQRRHQKVIEEAPAPDLGEGVEEAMLDAARTAAAAIDYSGAGTVEFLYDAARERFWFLEMNTRLQVEHPVTELVHGVDLVAMQIAVAEHDPLPAARDEEGHAIEVRLYAEDPAAGHQPQSGVLTTFEIPAGDGVRVDAGYEVGSTVSTHYDAMLAKIIVHAPSREAAARKLVGVLRRTRVHGVATNRDQLIAALRSALFLEPDGLGHDVLGALGSPTVVDPGAPIAAAIGVAERARAARTVHQRIPVAWRNVPSQPQRTTFTGPGGEERVVAWWGGRDGYLVDGLTVVAASADRVVLERDGVRSSYDLVVSGLPGREVVDVDSASGHVRFTRVPRFTDPAAAVASGSLLAPMPGTVVSVAVAKGDPVAAGQPVLVLEAMKMQHTVSAPHAGVVDRIDVEPGAQVAAGEVLAVVASDPAPEEES